MVYWGNVVDIELCSKGSALCLPDFGRRLAGGKLKSFKADEDLF